ncbi:MAG: PAS domain-containing protein [Balneolaceae bacterium]|nr:PAS domain-containing protein [Balneolaceae bacterium]
MEFSSLDTLRSAFENSLEGVVISDMRKAGQPIVYCNPSFLELTGYGREEVLGRNCRFLQNGLNGQPGLRKLRRAIRRGEACKVTLKNFKKSGELFFNRLSVFPLRGQGREITHYIGIQDDVTDLVAVRNELNIARNDRQALISEVHHRVKNNLAVFSSLLELDAWHDSETSVLLKNRLRVRTMSFVHENLYSRDGFSRVNFSDFVRDLVARYGSDRHLSPVRINFITELHREVELSINQAIPLALAMAEMIQNIYQHAYGERAIGTARISLREEEAGRVVLRVADYGRGLPENLLDDDDPQTTGFTVMRTLTEQLEGELDLENLENGGLCLSIAFRKSDAMDAGQAALL